MANKLFLKLRSKNLKKKLVILSLKDNKPGFPLLLHDEPILYDDKIVGRTTSANYSFNFNKNLAFGYVSINKSEDLKGNKFEIEIEKIRYKASIEYHPLFDPKNNYLKS